MQACKFRHLHGLAISTLSLLTISSSCVLAQNTDTTTGTAQPASSESAPPAAGKALTGKVQIITLDLDKLRDVGLDLKRIRHAASDLYDEVTLQPVSIQTQPEVVGRNIIYIPIGFSQTGYRPPSKKAIDACMTEMRPIITVMQDDVNDFVSGQKQFDLSDDTRETLKPLFEQWAQNVNEISDQLKTLDTLTGGPKYDNKAIGNAAAAIDKDCKALETIRKKIYKQIQKEGRTKKS
jgi:hypothetical protein